MKTIIEFLKRLGVEQGVTFKLECEDGVGLFVVPNPTPNRMQYRAVEVIPAAPPVCVARRRVSDRWVAKPLHLTW